MQSKVCRNLDCRRPLSINHKGPCPYCHDPNPHGIGLVGIIVLLFIVLALIAGGGH